MSGHRPMLSDLRMVADPVDHRGRWENRAKCECGWRGDWTREISEVDRDLRRHLDQHGYYG